MCNNTAKSSIIGAAIASICTGKDRIRATDEIKLRTNAERANYAAPSLCRQPDNAVDGRTGPKASGYYRRSFSAAKSHGLRRVCRRRRISRSQHKYPVNKPERVPKVLKQTTLQRQTTSLRWLPNSMPRRCGRTEVTQQHARQRDW